MTTHVKSKKKKKKENKGYSSYRFNRRRLNISIPVVSQTIYYLELYLTHLSLFLFKRKEDNSLNTKSTPMMVPSCTLR